MITKLAYRAATELSWKTLWKAGYLYAYKGWQATRAYDKRMKRGELYPPFMFIALTNTCNLRCKGCWVEKEGTAHYISEQDLDHLIESGKQQKSHYYTLLGGEPFMYKNIWDIFTRHKDCYFQAITNGMLFTERNVERLRAAGNVTPLISIDGWSENNDERRGDGVFEAIDKGLERLRQAKLFFGVATTTTAKNMDEVMSDAYVEHMIKKGAMYLWYYIYRPVGDTYHPEYCMTPDAIVEMRQRLLRLRRKHPIVLIDTYWTAKGEAFCPAAMGLGYHVGPQGTIEICPPLSFATDRISDNDGDVYKTINESSYLKGFAPFVKERTKGCVILEHPQALVDYMKEHGAEDVSGRDAYAEIARIEARNSHDLPGREIPEDYWFYKMMKNKVFFGMGAYG